MTARSGLLVVRLRSGEQLERWVRHDCRLLRCSVGGCANSRRCRPGAVSGGYDACCCGQLRGVRDGAVPRSC